MATTVILSFRADPHVVSVLGPVPTDCQPTSNPLPSDSAVAGDEARALLFGLPPTRF